jgi:hypothetical protein
MKYNTIRQYQEGGATRKALGQAFIGRGVIEAQEELEEEAKKAEKEGFFRKTLGTLGSLAGTYALPALATTLLGPVGLVGGALLKGAGAGLGRGLGETLGGVGAEDVSEGSTGFLAKDFSTLKDYQKGLGEGIGGRALGQAGATALTDFVLSGGFKALSDIRKSRRVADPALKQTMGFDIEAPELGLQRSLGGKDFLTSGPLTGSDVSLSDAISSDLSTDSSRAILSDASSISSQAPEAQFALRSGGLDMSPEFVQAPSLIGEEYALARDSLNTQREMEELSRNLGVSIARQEGKLGQVLANQDIRRQGLMDLGIDNVSPVSPYFNLPMAPNRAPIANTPSDASFIASYLSRLQRPKFKGGGLFNTMKTGRRIF